MWRMFLAISGALLVLGPVLVACAPAAPPSGPPASPALAPGAAPANPTPTVAPPAAAPAPERPRYGGILRSPNRADLPSFDYHQYKGTTANPVFAAYSQLVQFDPMDENRIIPDLAERWEISPDGKTYTFFLRTGVRFHDGKPLTSADVKATFDHILWPPKGVIQRLKDYYLQIARIETPDDRTVKFILKRPQAAFLSVIALSFSLIYPKHRLDADPHSMTKAIVGTGPFKLKEYMRGVSIEFEKNTDYYVAGRPYLDGIIRYIMTDAAAVVAALRTRRVDLLLMMHHDVTGPEREVLKKQNPELVIQVSPSVIHERFLFNHQREPWKDARVRKAAFLAVDRQKLVSMALQGDGVASGWLMPGSGWEIPTEELLKMPGYRQPKDQDLAEAKRLLAEAGYADGLKSKFMFDTTGGFTSSAVVLKDQLSKVGIELILEPVTDAVRKEREMLMEFQASRAGAGPGMADPEFVYGEYVVSTAAGNFTRVSPPGFDGLFLKQSEMMDPAERKRTVREMEMMLHRDPPIVMLYYRNGVTIHWPEVRDYVMPAVPNYLNLKFQDVWLAR